ncbi:MAG: glutamine amidotransferase [Dasania sp.]|jgi:glutamine amidotransferase
MLKICLIDYGAGNLKSVYNAVNRVIVDNKLNAVIEVTHDSTVLKSADKIILPGVGAFKACIDGLRQHDGLVETLNNKALGAQTPFLGICVGMQMMAEIGEEFGTHEGLGYISGTVSVFKGDTLKIPHMGWNKIIKTPTHSQHPVLKDIETGDYAYFVHSYKMTTEQKFIALECDYGVRFPAFVCHENMVGAQFHPEKSQKTGLTLLRNFLQWTI